MRRAFVNARLLDPASGLDTRGGLLVIDEAIADRGGHVRPGELSADTEIVDCEGHCLAPGLVDMRTQFREPGEEHKETIDSISRAAAAGGITALAGLPNTQPVIDEHGLGANARRKGRTHRRHTSIHCGRDRPAIRAEQHQRGADDHLLPVLRCTTGPQLAPDPDLGEIGNPNGDPLILGHHDRCQFVQIREASGRAHDVRFAIVFDVPRARIQVVALERDNEFVKGEPEGRERLRIRLDMVLLHIPANGVDAGHALDGLDLWGDDPILQRPEIRRTRQRRAEKLALRRQIRAVGLPTSLPRSDRGTASVGVYVLDRPHVDLAEARRNGAEHGLALGREP